MINQKNGLINNCDMSEVSKMNQDFLKGSFM